MSVRKVFHFLYRHYKTLQWSYPLDFLKTCTLWSPFLSEKTVQSLSLLLSHKLMQPDLADLLETLSSLYPALAPLVPLKIFGREFLTTHKNTYIEDVTWPRGDTNFSSSVSVCLNTRQGFWYFARSRSREIQVNPRNPAKFTKTRKIPRNSVEILSNTCLYNIFETYFSYRGYLLAVNLQIYLETSSLKRANNVPKLPGVNYVAKNWALAMMF